MEMPIFKGSLTKDATKTGSAVQDVPRSKLYPSVSLKKHGEEISVNFGQEPFVYNIDDMMNVCIYSKFYSPFHCSLANIMGIF